jgi:hypothetical protein
MYRHQTRKGQWGELINKTHNNLDGKEDYWFTPKKVLAYCLIVGIISTIVSIFIDWLGLLSMAAFVFTSITGWYMFAEKFHRWKERGKNRNKIEQVLIDLFPYLKTTKSLYQSSKMSE